MDKKYLFDYYIFVDYSENIIGYNIIEQDRIDDILPIISKLKHYKDVKHKREYLNAIRRIVEDERLKELLLKIKIKEIRQNIEIFADVTNFLKNNKQCIVFVSIDNNQYASFCRIIDIIDDQSNKIVKESDLKKDSPEYRLSLIIDNILNLYRTRKSK